MVVVETLLNLTPFVGFVLLVLALSTFVES